MIQGRIYFDHAATTGVDPVVIEAMLPYYGQIFGNPSSVHSFGRETRQVVEDARQVVAGELGAAQAHEIIFTGSGTESDNLALRGIALAYRDQGNHLITSAIEHPAVLDTCSYLERHGFKITYLPVDSAGLVDPDEVVRALTPETILVSIMHGNNEIGTLEPIAEIAKLLKERKVLFHTDAVQTVGTIPVNVQELQVDLLSLTAHKFYGPKGIGALYVRQGVKLQPLIYGGAQEWNRRAGTENLPGVVGLARALQLANEKLAENSEYITKLRDYLISRVFLEIDRVQLNGHPSLRLPGNINLSFDSVKDESLLLNLDLKGIAASSGSACTAGSLEPSHVLLALGLKPEAATGSLRISLGKSNTQEEVDCLMKILPELVRKLRSS